MFISFVFAEIFLRLFICLLCAVPWNAHNAPSSRVSLYHCIWNLKSNRHLTPPSLRLLRPQWAINMPALLVLPHMAHQGYSMHTLVCKLCIFYLNNVDLSKSSERPKHSIQPKNYYQDSRARLPVTPVLYEHEHWTTSGPAPLDTRDES